jgi:hypothetical protein
VEPIRSGSQRGGVELAAPPGSDWCGDRRGVRELRRRRSAAVRT